MVTLACILALALNQIPDFGGKAQAEKIKALSFLEGRWEGEAWAHAQGRKIPVKGYELVEFKAAGTCVIVSAEWTMNAGGRDIPIHETCAMIVWDSAKNGYRMTAQLGNGLRNEFDLNVRKDGFDWKATIPQMGEVRYTMNLQDGVWHEVGERQMPDGSWVPSLEMKLRKVGAVAAAVKVDRAKFDPEADAAKDIAAGIAKAKAEGKRVMLDVGGEWCGWCHKLDKLFTTDATVKQLLANHYVVVKVNFSPENKNEAVLSKYPKISGYPHLFVLDESGKLLHSQDTGLLETGDHHDPEKVITFLKKWSK